MIHSIQSVGFWLGEAVAHAFAPLRPDPTRTPPSIGVQPYSSHPRKGW
jgi:hypothetical protein